LNVEYDTVCNADGTNNAGWAVSKLEYRAAIVVNKMSIGAVIM
jgi:hypothetical protein